jgi:hypothetical protein
MLTKNEKGRTIVVDKELKTNDQYGQGINVNNKSVKTKDKCRKKLT